MRRAFPIILALLGILLVAGSAGSVLLGSAVDNPAGLPLPDRIARLDRTSYVTGREAAAEFQNLHGEQFPVISGAVGMYGPNHQITIWVAGTPVNFMAAQLVDAMHRKISEGRSPFTETDAFEDRGRTVYVLTGMGQQHYYFRSGNRIIWLASEPAIATEAIRGMLEEYP
jgi:hypothetical protein